jgi:hypothetical protein
MDEGELSRYLAEAPWYPTALLPAAGIEWEPVDDSAARSKGDQMHAVPDGGVTDNGEEAADNVGGADE